MSCRFPAHHWYIIEAWFLGTFNICWLPHPCQYPLRMAVSHDSRSYLGPAAVDLTCRLRLWIKHRVKIAASKPIKAAKLAPSFSVTGKTGPMEQATVAFARFFDRFNATASAASAGARWTWLVASWCFEYCFGYGTVVECLSKLVDRWRNQVASAIADATRATVAVAERYQLVAEDGFGTSFKYS